MNDALVKLSKFLSLVLRHQPGKIGLTLDKEGWADVSDLIAKANAVGTELSEAVIQEVVAGDDKQRLALSPDGKRIRASQGHSIQVDLGLEPAEPPAILYHGTTLRLLGSILRQGLKRQGRQYVHLSPDVVTAKQVGQRHGKPVVVQIDAGQMQTNGFVFFQSENGVWLTEEVPVQYVHTLGK